jgi:hypothetical protein
MDRAIMSPIPPTQMCTDAALGRLHIESIPVLQHHPLDITANGFDRLVIGTPLRQRNPVHL